MKSVSLWFAACAAATTLAPLPVLGLGQQTPASATVIASQLNGPRGLKFGPDGLLYVALAGTGGTTSTRGICTQVPAPVGPYTGGPSASIVKIDSQGKMTNVATGLPSTVSGGGIIGVADVAFVGENLYALVAGAGCSHGNPGFASGIYTVNRANGAWTRLANIGDFLKSHPAAFESADDFEPDGTLYSMIAVNGTLYTVEPNHGQVFSVSTSGAIQQLIDISASEGHIVPTAIAYQAGSFYVGNLSLFPIDPHWARILTISKEDVQINPAPGFDTDKSGYHVINSKAGFTTVVGVDFGPDGLLYVLELSDAPGFPTGNAGRVVRITHSGAIQTVISGLTVPTGMTFDSRGRLYVSNLGAGPPGAGQILRFDISPGF